MSTATHPVTELRSSQELAYGAVGGLAGGVVFGMLMQMMGMIPMVAQLVGSSSVVVGWLVHLAISAFAGAAFGLIVGSRVHHVWAAVGIGLAYGVLWWVGGALLIMPARLGMDVFVLNAVAWQSLMGHLIFGAVLGAVYGASARHRHG
jgi:hypothetical protein